MKRFLRFVAGAVFLLASCNQKDYSPEMHDPALYRDAVKKLNDVVLENGFPPMVASRNYVYANIAAYEVIAAGDTLDYRSLAGQIRHLPAGPRPEPGKPVDFHYAALLAFLQVGNAVTFPEGSMDEYVQSLKDKAKKAGMPSAVMKNSAAFAERVAGHILNWSKGDNYAQTRSASKFTVLNEDGRWIPTPPMYSQAMEPHWCKIRPMVLDSASQVVPPPPAPFNMKDRNSVFYKNAMEVKLLGDSLSDEQKHIADFWDDNAFKLNVSGHVMYGTKKFSPGGHWMNIVGIATRDRKADFNSTVSVYTEASIALFDSFINCWYVKFQRNYVRPETVINKYLDPDWKPYIQTPPFPEYTSGHAVISAAVAEVLSSRLGDQVSFSDSSQMEFGIRPRSFPSFREAAREAGMSRVYGGIHYVASCEKGAENGVQIGRMVANRIHLKKEAVLSAR